MNTAFIALALVSIWLLIENLRLKLQLLKNVKVLSKGADALEKTTDKLRQSNKAYTELVGRVLPEDEKIQLAFRDYKEALEDYEKETEPLNVDIRRHHYNVAAEKFQKVCEEYDKNINT